MKMWILVTSPKKVMALEESRLSATEADQTFLWWDNSGSKWGLKYARVQQCGREFDEDGARWTDSVNCSPNKTEKWRAVAPKNAAAAHQRTQTERGICQRKQETQETLQKRWKSLKIPVQWRSTMVFVRETIGSGTAGGEAQRRKTHPAEKKPKGRSSTVKSFAGISFLKSGEMREKLRFHRKKETFFQIKKMFHVHACFSWERTAMLKVCTLTFGDGWNPPSK